MPPPLEALDPLPPEQRLAIAWSAPVARDRLASMLAFDRRLARIVTRTREPLLGQMRLAWWRDTLGLRVAARPRGDVVLEALGTFWDGREAGLIALVDGWEQVLLEKPLSVDAAGRFAEGRSAALLGVYDGDDPAEQPGAASRRAAWCWSLGDFAARVSDPGERAMLAKLGLGTSGPERRLPRRERGLAVLGALGERALRRGGRPLMEGRGAAIAVMRAAIFGG